MDPEFWNKRYSEEGYVYGTEPNAFVAECARQIPQGPVLCLAEGEGRNAAYLAALDHATTAVDVSETGLRKARALAASRGLSVKTVVADLMDFDQGRDCWSGIVATFAHLPPEKRKGVHARAVQALAPGGLMILEAYAPRQITFGTGGPRDPALLMDLAQLRAEFEGLDFLVAREIERNVVEGIGHTGRAVVVQILGRKPKKPAA